MWPRAYLVWHFLAGPVARIHINGRFSRKTEADRRRSPLSLIYVIDRRNRFGSLLHRCSRCARCGGQTTDRCSRILPDILGGNGIPAAKSRRSPPLRSSRDKTRKDGSREFNQTRIRRRTILIILKINKIFREEDREGGGGGRGLLRL